MDRRTVALVVAVVAVLLAIYLLAHQEVRGTQSLARRVEQLLAQVVPPTGTGSAGEPTWLGLTIRRLAHVVEYLALGCVTTLAAHAILGQTGTALVASGAFCLVASVADETHKIFVPGRHFDARDLLLDAAGYLLACLAVVAAIALRDARG